MFTVIVILMALFLMYVTGENGEWGPFVLAIVIAGILLLIKSGCSRGTKAYSNFVDYWADDDRDKK